MKNNKPSLWRDVLEVLAGLAVFAVLLGGFLFAVKSCAEETLHAASKMAEDASKCDEEAILEAERYGEGNDASVEVRTALRVFSEEDVPLPAWWDPEDADVVWEDVPETEAVRRNAGCPDWNVDSTLYGWDGHVCEAWEMDLFSRIFYLEYWGSSDVLCEAGCDAMLNLWDLNGGTMFESLSHVNENGSYTYSTFPGMWEEEYDPEGLAWCRRFCEERFFRGPVWEAQYFRKGQYHDWGEWSPIPAYEIDGIYFSIGR